MNQKIVLIVEDDYALRSVLEARLRLAGLVVFCAKNADTGLKVALENHPDLILLDFVMPGDSGLDFLSELRQSGDWGKSASVVFLTSMEDPKIAEHGAQFGVTEYIVKSDWKLEMVVDKVLSVLGG
ncbi:MAG: response regulator [Candidatus Moranbacteria bacterium]|nr:response regulator [Candidatus Moranbacteria bacterium]